MIRPRGTVRAGVRVLLAVSLLVASLVGTQSAASAQRAHGPTVSAFGASAHHGDPAGLALHAHIVDMDTTPIGHGYWLAAADGGIFAYGDATFHGSSAGTGAEVVDMARTNSGRGYWLLTDDGGISAHGDAPLLGGVSGGQAVAITSKPVAEGYWIVQSPA